MKNIIILGSTGSIGQSALKVVASNRDRFRVVALAANGSDDVLLRQIDEFRPEAVALNDPSAAARLREKTKTTILQGPSGIEAVASHPGGDFVISAIVGAAGLRPTMAAIRAGKTIGLANKETLVVAGDIMTAEAEKSGSAILPVDSEHSAVFQCLQCGGRRFMGRIILTASGGPFFGMPHKELDKVTVNDALRHPSWSMGRKITVDSATLMNKGLEVIEAHHLFGAAPDRIDVVIHPQSIIHSIVEFTDGSSIAQMSVPDMRGAIAYAMSYPERLDGVLPALDLASLGTLTFAKPDTKSFPCLGYAYDALNAGGAMTAVLNAANEAAVAAFLEGKIGFNDIPRVISGTMESHKDNRPPSGLDELEEVMQKASMRAHEFISSRAALR